MKHGMLDGAMLQRLIYQALDDSEDLIVVLEQVGDAADGLMVAATNDAFCRASGHKPADLIGVAFRSLAASEASPATWAASEQSVRDRQSFRSELLCTRPNGTSFWLGMHLMPVARSTRPCSVLLGRDITASLRDRRQQAAIQGLLAKVFVTVRAAVTIVEEHGLIAMANPACDRLLGYPPGGLIGKTSIELIAPSVRSALLEARGDQVANRQDYTVETLMLHADGSEIPVDLASTLVEREDLKRFRIMTLTPRAGNEPAQPMAVHVAGKIKLIGLEEIKASLGSRWPALAARVMQTAEHIVKRRCGPRDSWSRTDDSGFVIIFGDLNEAEATLRAATIARDIRARLIGEGEQPSTAQVTAITTPVDLPQGAERSPAVVAEAIGERLNARLGEIEGRARETLRQLVKGATCELTPLHSRQQFKNVGDFATLPRALEQRVQGALMALPSREGETFDYDRFVLRAAVDKLVGRIAGGNLLPIFVSVDFEVFMDRRCTERYIAACQSLDVRFRQHLVLVLSHLPDSVARTRVLDCVTRLRPFCQMVAFQTDGLKPPPVESSALSGSIVMLNESELEGWSPADLTRLETLIGYLHGERARILVRHVSNLANAKRLLEKGVDLISLANEAVSP
jgi:PAS domain S-box-containing protein